MWLCLVLLGAVGLATGYWYFVPSQIGRVNVTCRYMGYACEDALQYQIVEFANSEKKYKFLLNKDIKVVFVSSDLEKRIKKQTEKFVIGYKYYFSGRLIFSRKDKYFLMIETAKAIKRFKE